MLQPGDSIGDWEIVSRLKAGGMATLFLGRPRGSSDASSHVAIKVVHPHLAESPAFTEMFLDEARLSSTIQHANVVRTLEYGHAEETLYMVLEYVHGGTLTQLLDTLGERDRRLSQTVAVWIALQVAEGLHAAHETRGVDGKLLEVVHRDVSPQNVLLSHAGDVMLIDFGIAKARGRVHLTMTGTIKGKVRYMAPEQATAGQVDRRTDVYALGIVLWEMLTMQPYFAGEEAEVVGKIRTPTPVPPSSEADDIPPALDDAVLRALAPDKNDRPPSAEAFKELLAEALPAAAHVGRPTVAGLVHKLLADELDSRAKRLPEQLRSKLGTEQSAVEADASSREVTLPRAPRRAGTVTVSNPSSFYRGGADEPGDGASHTAPERPAHKLPPAPEPPSKPSARPLPPAPAPPPHAGPPRPVPESPYATPAPAEANAAPARSAGGPNRLHRVLAAAVVGAAALVVGLGIGLARSGTAPAPENELADEPESAAAVPPDEPDEPDEPDTSSTGQGVSPAPTSDADEDSRMARVRQCLMEGDNQCAVDALEGQTSSASELAMLIETYRTMGNTEDARAAMERFVERYPDDGRLPRYQRKLEDFDTRVAAESDAGSGTEPSAAEAEEQPRQRPAWRKRHRRNRATERRQRDRDEDDMRWVPLAEDVEL